MSVSTIETVETQKTKPEEPGIWHRYYKSELVKKSLGLPYKTRCGIVREPNRKNSWKKTDELSSMERCVVCQAI